ncbi:phosphoribosylaminoimidazolesuccinocarboxamide synthase, partial [Vibrio alfacsensis]
REALAADNELPLSALMDVSKTYVGIAEKITGRKIELSSNPKQEIIDILRTNYDLIAD